MGEIVDALGDLVLGARCAGCGVAVFGLCRHCAAVLRGLRPGVVSRPLPGFPRTAAAGEYTSELRQVLLATKERGALVHLPLLGGLLARAAAVLLVPGVPLPVVLVPVPTVAARVAERGLDLPAALAVRARRELGRAGVPVRVSRAVRLVRDTDDQVGLDRAARVANLARAYRWVGQPSPGSVVVVDDVVTTGATLTAVTDAVRAAGTRLLGAATVAQTAKRGDQPAPAPR